MIEKANNADLPDELRAQGIAQKDLRRREFILNANLWEVIFRISFPLMLINFLTFIYDIIDSMLAAKISAESIASVIVLSQINNMLRIIGLSLASGGMIIISRLIGRKDFDRAKTIANTMVIIAVFMALMIWIIIIPLSRPMLKLFGASDNIIQNGLSYFRIQIATSGVMLINNVFFGLEKSRGRMANVMWLNMTIIIAKIALSVVLVYGFKVRQLIWISMTTLIANLALTVFVIIRLAMPKYFFRFNYKERDLSRRTLKAIFGLSIPIFIGRFMFSLGKVLVNAISANFYSSGKYADEAVYGQHYGDRVTGALGISNHLGGFTTNVLNSVDESEAQIISVNLGHKNQARALKAFSYSLIINLCLAAAGVTIFVIFNDMFVQIYAQGDADYAKMISDIFFYERIAIIMLAVNSSVNGLLYGFGYTKIAGIMNLSRVIAYRIPILLIMLYVADIGYQSVGIAMMVSNICIGLMSIVVGIIYIRKIKKKNITDTLEIGKT